MSAKDGMILPAFYQGYVDTVHEHDLFEALSSTINAYRETVGLIPEEKGNFAYAEGKWTIRELLGHVIDAERIFAYRALRFARNDKTELPGFDEVSFNQESNAKHRTLESLLLELEGVRKSSVDLFRSFSPEMMARSGVANGNRIAVRALGFVIAGHSRHHLNILRERYLSI